MATPESAATPSAATAPLLRGRLRLVEPLDWVMLALALASVALLVYEAWWPVSDTVRARIVGADLAICGIFAIEFLFRWSRAGWSASYVWRNWYDILGMIPVAHPALRGLRLLRVVRIVVMLSRLGLAADRAFGDEFTYRVVTRVRDSVVEAIGGAVTLYVLDEVAKVLHKGAYTRNIARALAENRSELETLIVEKVRADARSGRLRRLPFYDDIVRSVARAALDVAGEILADPRTDELVGDMLRENLQQIREAVRQDESSRGRV